MTMPNGWMHTCTKSRIIGITYGIKNIIWKFSFISNYSKDHIYLIWASKLK
jgi:hypothetical protein